MTKKCPYFGLHLKSEPFDGQMYKNNLNTMLYKLFHSVLDQIISREITAYNIAPLLFPFMHFAIP